MANSKWTKWIVGLTGAALFSGFVGIISNEGIATATQSGSQNSQNENKGDQSSAIDQWSSTEGNSAGGGGQGFRRRSDAGDESFGLRNGDSSGQTSPDFDGSMRSRAS